MPKLIACPEAAVLKQLLEGQRTSEEWQAFAEHLQGCSRCVESLEGLLANDTLREALQAQAAVEQAHAQVVEGSGAQLVVHFGGGAEVEFGGGRGVGGGEERCLFAFRRGLAGFFDRSGDCCGRGLVEWLVS